MLAGRTSIAVELAVHDIDVMRAIAGDVTSAHAEACSTGPFEPGRQSALVGTLRFGSGAVASVEASWILPDAYGPAVDFRLEVVGRDGRAVVELGHDGDDIVSSAGVCRTTTLAYVDAGGSPRGLLRLEDEYFLEMLGGGPRWPVSVADARDTLAVAIAMDRAIELGRPVNVSEVV